MKVSVVNTEKALNLEWRVYLENSPALGTVLTSIIKSELINAEYLINCMSNYYDLQTKIPRINIDGFLGSKNISSKLYYDPKDMTINIKDQLILKFFSNKNSIELENTRNEFLWGIAHEFFHHGRNHIAIWNHYGIKENDASSKHNHILLCLEDDADNLATTAIYRYFLNIVHKRSDSYTIKLKVLASLYKTIRTKIQETKNHVATTHPGWNTRLCSQIIKLSELDNVFNDPLCPKVRVTNYTINQQNWLTHELIKMEKDFCDDLELIHYILKPVNPSKDGKILNKIDSEVPLMPITQRFSDLFDLNESFKEVEKLIKKNCNLPGLNRFGDWMQWQPKLAQSNIF